MPGLCPSCGAEVADGLRFCPHCHEFLAWDEAIPAGAAVSPGAVAPPGASAPLAGHAPTGATPPDAPAPSANRPDPPPGPTTGGAAGRPVLRWSGEELHVEPGGAVEATVEVATSGSLVDEIELALSGPAARFGEVEPASVNLYPGTSQAVTVRFHPPHGPDPHAGSHPWMLHAVSPIYAGAARTVAGVVEVAAFTSGTAELVPAKTVGRSRRFSHRIVLANAGNVPWTARLRCEAPPVVHVGEPTPTITVAPGTSADVPLAARTRWHWIGSAQTHELAVHVEPIGEPAPAATTLPGTRVQQAFVPLWVLPVLLALVALAIAAYAVFGGSSVAIPAVGGKTAPEALAVLEQAGFTVTQAVVPDDRIAQGRAIGTDPPAGTQVDEGSAVTLQLSAGATAGQIVIPEVVGLPRSDAVDQIERAGLRTRIVEAASADQPAGQVTRTVPDAGVQVPPDYRVAVYVSSGPGQVPVPRLVGKTEDEAVAALTDLGLRHEVTRQASDSIPSGSVIASDPEAGASVSAGGSVGLVVSTGPQAPPAGEVTVPRVSDQDKDQARSDLEALDLVVTVQEQASETVPPGTAIGTSPDAGTQLTAGDAVTLLVSTGPSVTDDPTDLLGLAADDSAVLGYTQAHGVTASGSDLALDNGVLLVIDPAENTVAAVTLDPSFPGELPGGMAWTQTADSLSSLLGTPVSLGNTGPAGELVGVWTLALDAISTAEVTFDPATGQPWTITLRGPAT